MSLLRWRIGLGLAACVLALTGVGRAAAQDSPHENGKDSHHDRQQFYRNLTEVHNYGANLYNNGDWAGCYRFFEGSLMMLRPHLAAHHPGLHKTVTDALALAQAEPNMVNRAWLLREALLKVRKAHASEKGSANRPDDRPKPDEEPRENPKPRPKPPTNPPVTKKTLWDRLGGEEGVSHIIDDIVTTASRDPKVNFFRGGKYKLDGAGVKRLKQHMIQQASGLTGGPLHYEGESMKQVHKGMNITNAEFDAFMGHVKDALEKNNVSPSDAATILSALSGKRKDIVEASKPEDKKPADPRPEDKKPGDKKLGDPKPVDKKPDGKKTTDPFAPRTDKKPSTELPADRKPAEIKAGQQSHISGKVMFQGKAIPGGEVELHPATGKAITARIKDGNYSTNVLPGDYAVTIKAEKLKVPQRYKDKQTTPLRLHATGGKQNLDVQLMP